MFQAKLRGWRLLAAGLVLAPSFTGLGADALGLLSRARADERPMVASRVDEARDLMRQARAELNANNFGKAKQLAEQARAMQAPAQFYDDNPEDILADISKKSGTKPSRPAKPTTTDPRALMEMAKQAMDHGDIDRAQDLVMQAQANSASVRWGLFEDTPSSLMKDIQKVKSRRDRDMSERMISEARMLLEKKAASKAERAQNVATAEERARIAEKLHGPYSVWDFGDKPMDIFSEARTIREKEQLSAAMAQGKTPRDPAITQASAKLNPDEMPARAGSSDPAAAKSKATGLMKEAVGLMNGGNFAEARIKLIEAGKLNASFGRDEDTPEIVLGNLNILAQRKMSKLCDEARECISRKDMVAARSKLDEAEQIASSMKLDAGRVHDLRVSLKPTKPTQSEVVNESLPPLTPVPTKATQPTITVAGGDDLPPPIVRNGKGSEPDTQLPIIKNGTGNSVDLPLIKNGSGEPALAPLVTSEKPEPTAAPIIKNATPEKATGGNVDLVLPLPVDSKPEVKPVITKTPVPIPAAPAADRGLELLEKARLELRNGQIESARKICVTILAGSFTCKSEAEALLNTIDTQEVEQKKVTSRRAFENGLASMTAQNYSQALAIFKEIDPAMLPANKRMQLDEAISAAESKQKALTALAQGKATVDGTLPAPAPAAPAAKTGEDSLLKQQDALAQVEFQKFRSEALKIESSATARFGRGETEAAVKDLQAFVKKVQASNLDKSKQALLVRPIEARLDRLLILKHQSDFLTKEAKDQADFKREMSQEALAKRGKEEEVAKLMKEVVKLNDQAKHKEAYVLVQKAHQIDPDNVTVNAQMQITELLFRKGEFARVKGDQERYNWNEINEMWETPQVTSKDPIVFSKDSDHLTRLRNRGNGTIGTNRMRSEKDKVLERKMLSNVTINFKSVPLESVVEHLATTTNLNFNLDYAGLKEANVDPKLPITAKLDSVSLKSAMEIICQQAGLKHLIENEAIRVTTAKNAAGRQRRVTIPVGELVIPTPSFGAAPGSTLNEQLRMAQLSAQGGNLNPATPRNGNLPGGMGIGAGTDGNPFPTASGRLNNGPREGGASSGINHTGTLEKELINLITSTIKPDSWRAMGGEGTIEYFPTGLALVVNQSPEVIEEVERLLESLRKLQDLEVSIEIKVVSLSETFYERIGVDFSMAIPTNARAGTGNPAYINSGSFSGNVIGMQAPGVATPDLDIPIRATSFARAIPPFGGFTNTFADGGISLGLAFLNDCQVQMFLDAAQGDTRTNVMQAPKLTALNGTSASMTVGDVQFFLTGINVASVAGQLVFQPVNTPFQVGITQPVPPNVSVQNGLVNFTPTAPQTPGLGLFIQPVVSADRRFVRLNIQQSFTSLVSGTQQVPITTVITPVFENGGQGQPVPLTQYLQQPRFSNLETQTVVVVPDGGTVVMGGLKYMTEGRMEFGPPVLGKIPYLNRLFRNVAYGREARSILIMVTPRIIINREEQERQTGVREDDYIGEALGNR